MPSDNLEPLKLILDFIFGRPSAGTSWDFERCNKLEKETTASVYVISNRMLCRARRASRSVVNLGGVKRASIFLHHVKANGYDGRDVQQEVFVDCLTLWKRYCRRRILETMWKQRTDARVLYR